MKKFLIAVLAFVSLSASATTLNFNDWKVKVGDEYTYTTNRANNSVTEFKLGVGWFSILEYPDDTQFTSFIDGGAEKTNMVWSVNGTNVKFIVHRDINGWFKAVPETNKGRKFVIEQFWSSSTVKFVSQQNGSTFYVSASGVQRAYSYIFKSRAI